MICARSRSLALGVVSYNCRSSVTWVSDKGGRVRGLAIVPFRKDGQHHITPALYRKYFLEVYRPIARAGIAPVPHGRQGPRSRGGSAACGVAPHARLAHGVDRASRPPCVHAGAHPSPAAPAGPSRQPEPAPRRPAPLGWPTRRDAGWAPLGPDAPGALPPPL